MRDPDLIPGSGRSPGEENATHSSILAYRIPWTEETGGLPSMGLQQVGHDWLTNTNTHHCTIVRISKVEPQSMNMHTWCSKVPRFFQNLLITWVPSVATLIFPPRVTVQVPWVSLYFSCLKQYSRSINQKESVKMPISIWYFYCPFQFLYPDLRPFLLFHKIFSFVTSPF